MPTSGNAWTGLIDDAAIFPPGDAELSAAIEAHGTREEAPARLVRSFVVRDTDLPALAGFTDPVTIVLTGGAGQVDGALRQAAKLDLRVVGLETALRDLDDLAGNARRVTTAIENAEAEGLLAPHTEVYVEMPATRTDHGWLAAADEIAAIELRLKFRTGGPDADAFPTSAALASWIDAALDRETPFKCTAGLHRAVRHTSAEGWEEHGFLNVLLATLLLFDGDPRGKSVLEERDAAALLELTEEHDLTRSRRWFTSIGSCSVDEPYADLVALGLIESGPIDQ
ncbi:hypothetical protein GCM10027020_26690 [Nocardioides salsibiostraticola]